MQLSKILVADDDPNVIDIIRLYFEQQHIQLLVAHDGEQAVSLADKEEPDVIILDVMMPKMDGFEACKEIRKHHDTPIIMLTAKGEEFDRVLGLELGADDYMTKPFSPRELMARIKAIFRRLQPRQLDTRDSAEQQEYHYHGIRIIPERREILIDEQKIAFRPKEFDLMLFLAKSPGKVYTREQLLDQVWNYDFMGDIRTVDVHVKKIRQKLREHGKDFIHTVWGVGYKFEVES